MCKISLINGTRDALTRMNFARHYSIPFKLQLIYLRWKVNVAGSESKWEIRHSSASRRIASRRFYSARDQQYEAKKGEQQRHNSPQLTLSFFCATRSFSNLVLVARCAFIVTARLPSLTWSEKWKAWHSFSLTKATGTLALSFFFISFLLRHRVHHWWIPEDARTLLSSNFIV